jgi:hypothetical protein
MESAWVRCVDCRCQNTSEAPANKGCWSTVFPLGLGKMKEEAGMFYLEGADQRSTDTGHCSLLDGFSGAVVVMGDCINNNGSQSMADY